VRLVEAMRGRGVVVEAEDEAQARVACGKVHELLAEDNLGVAPRVVNEHKVLNRVPHR
jgi:hypothetical protein